MPPLQQQQKQQQEEEEEEEEEEGTVGMGEGGRERGWRGLDGV